MQNRKENASEWFNEILDVAELVDKRYPIKGMNVLPPYGFKIMSLIDKCIREAVDSKGFQETLFPLLVSSEQLSVEFEHVKGFSGEVFWVTRGGNEKLDVELALRPTSEAVMYPMFALWIRTHTDLPLRIYQIVNIYRYETKHTRALIRDREVHFFEAHTAHATFEDAESQMTEYMQIMKSLSKRLCLPYTINKRPDWDKFPGAQYSLAFDLILPSGRSLQVGTIHQYGENFARNYDIGYSDPDGNRKVVSQTTYGMSGRLLAAVIFMHGDDKGLILPPFLAPYQFVVVPIPGENSGLMEYCEKVTERIYASGYRVHLDKRESYTPGYKYNDWEMRGVPARIEIGSREVDGNYVTLVPRNTGKRKKVALSELNDTLRSTIIEIEDSLMKTAKETMNRLTVKVKDLNNAKSTTGMIKLSWCGEKACSDKIEELTELTCLGLPIEDVVKGNCVVCGKPGTEALFARTY